MRKKKKTQSEYILDVLIDNKALKLRDITKMVSRARRKETKIENISSMLTKLCNPENAAIGHFLNRTKTRRRYEYLLVPEILALSPHEIYDLSRNIGRDRFTLRMALEKVPELAQYVKLPPGSEMRQATIDDVVAGFLHEMDKMGGLRVNFYLTVGLLKEGKNQKGR